MEYWHSLTLTTEPTVEPVTKAEAKLYIKQPDSITADDDLIDSLIETARKLAEDYCNRAFIDQTWTLSLNATPDIIPIPKGYLDSITSINVYADDGTATLQDSDDYQVVTGEGATVFLESSNSWTSTTRPVDQMRIVFKAGYGAAATSVPEGIKTGIKQLILQMYEDRGNTELTSLTRSVLQPYKLYNI